jgi:hypothetical protein
MRKRMYRRGRRLSMAALARRLLRQEYVFLGDRPVHPSFMTSMTFWTLVWMCRKGRLRAAVRTK